MNTLEDRLRAALRTGAEDFSADPDAWQQIRARSLAARNGRGPRHWPQPSRFMIPAAAAAAVVAVIVVVTVVVNGVTGRSAGAPADGVRPSNSATANPGAVPSPAGPYAPSGPAEEMLTVDPPASAVIGLDIPPTAANANRAVGYFWIGYASPDYWFDRISSGPQLCNDTVNVTNGQSSGFCWPLPQLSAGHLASVTGNEQVGTGQMILLGAAAAQVTSVTAVLPDGHAFPGVVKTGRGFPGQAWTVGYPPASGVRLVFRDASGAEVASLGAAAPQGPTQVAQPSSGGLVVFRYPAGTHSAAGSVTAYLIQGRVGFFTGTWGGLMAPVAADGRPAVDGLVQSFGFSQSPQHPNAPPKLSEAFGYAHADVARIVLHLPGGRQVSTSTFAAWPGSGLRLWAVKVPPRMDYLGQRVTATAYDTAGHVIEQDTLGSLG